MTRSETQRGGRFRIDIDRQRRDEGGRRGGFVEKTTMRYSRSIISGLAMAADVAIVFFSGFSIYLLYVGYIAADVTAYMWALSINSLLIVAMLHGAKMYRFNALTSLADQIKKIVSVTMLVFLLMIATGFALKVSAQFSRVWAFSWFGSIVVLLVLQRVAIDNFVRRSARNGRLTRNAVIVGADTQGKQLLARLQRLDHPWVRILGFFDDRGARVPKEVGQLPVLGDVDDLIEFARSNRCDDILIALPWPAAKRIISIIDKLEVLPTDVRLAPDLAGLELARYPYGEYGGITVLNILVQPLKGWRSVTKSILDRVLAVIILLGLSPLLITIMVLIKLDSPGPVFFRQCRYGFNNKPIEILKFRTLRVDQQDDDAVTLVTVNDDRVTRFGAFLRRTSLDEFPQFLSVLKGEMSIVGPRPHAFKASAAGKLYEDAVAQYAMRHKVKPGITGWAQVNGWRGETDTEEKIVKRVEHDIYYIRNWSLLLDLHIILRTALIFFRQQSAY